MNFSFKSDNPPSQLNLNFSFLASLSLLSEVILNLTLTGGRIIGGGGTGGAGGGGGGKGITGGGR